VDNHVLNTIDPRVVGERLAEARRARRLTQQQAAEALDVARTTIVAIEKGDRRPRAAELVKLAQLYGRSISEFVQHSTERPQPDFIVQFRMARGQRDAESDANRADDLRTFQNHCQWYAELEDVLDAPLSRRYPEPYDVSSTPHELAAEEVASSERNRLGLGDGPVGNLWGLLESDVGLRVFAIPMSDRQIAGLFVYTEEYGGCIAVNANHPEGRRRLSAAHEYAHFLTNRHTPEITVLRSWKKMPEAERLADAFARHFLMPSAGLRRRFASVRRAKDSPITPADLLALTHLYQVSFQSMTWRLEELKLLPPGTWEKLNDLGFHPDKAREYLHLPEQDASLSRLPLRYKTLAVQAFLDGHLTEGQLAERLQTDRLGARETVRELTVQDRLTDEGHWQQVPLNLSAPLVGIS
jgi:Zn-dependent peptidase ImmA (M78 family)/transcriptional regulator with XRE-family HTH domain